MKRLLLAAAEAGWDVRRRLSHITTACRQLIAPCLLNILYLHQKQRFVIKKHHDTKGCYNASLPAAKDRKSQRGNEQNENRISSFCTQKKVVLESVFMMTGLACVKTPLTEAG